MEKYPDITWTRDAFSFDSADFRLLSSSANKYQFLLFWLILDLACNLNVAERVDYFLAREYRLGPRTASDIQSTRVSELDGAKSMDFICCLDQKIHGHRYGHRC